MLHPHSLNSKLALVISECQPFARFATPCRVQTVWGHSKMHSIGLLEGIQDRSGEDTTASRCVCVQTSLQGPAVLPWRIGISARIGVAPRQYSVRNRSIGRQSTDQPERDADSFVGLRCPSIAAHQYVVRRTRCRGDQGIVGGSAADADLH
jgi:hypothetical protein